MKNLTKEQRKLQVSFLQKKVANLDTALEQRNHPDTVEALSEIEELIYDIRLLMDAPKQFKTRTELREKMEALGFAVEQDNDNSYVIYTGLVRAKDGSDNLVPVDEDV